LKTDIDLSINLSKEDINSTTTTSSSLK